jgi:capsular polysaccharide biosynthesis protein
LTINAALRALFRGWSILLLGTLIGAGAAIGVSTISPQTYTSTASVFISVPPANEGEQAVEDAQVIARVVAKNYVELVEADLVLERTAADKSLDVTTDDLARGISSSNPEGTSVIDITFTGGDKESVDEIANAVADNFASIASENPAVPGLQLNSAVTVEVVSAARPAHYPDDERAKKNIILGSGLGFALSAAFVMVSARRRSTA